MSILTVRKRAGLKQADLAKALGISVAAVSTWESGRSNPTADKLPVIAKLCDCTIEEILKEDK